ncbi:nucleotidyltransferase family protein [Cohaesibacter celericrescens]|uniref:Nucleotidyltransferase family protein n=1 Tax=Cohaesibacter celericrescens TaxID=2067669 RepID=A0A2N5XQ32_9HYPH|nr:nucleotidyltransferase family protein [Cohaesibacter celericrescens]PLW76639.1 hypothetical protein C0081_13680 [Cohaesibacter celericrescens]
MTTSHKRKRIFPSPSWAWPKNSLEALILAAAHPDETLAFQIFARWMRDHDIDDVSWAEQRLLLAVAERFPGSRFDVDNRGRLNGLVRVFWTKSKLALKVADPAIAALQREGIDCLIFKGAARTLEEAVTVKGRVANDVDIMVQPSHFKQAIEILCHNGWQADNGFSLLRCRAHTSAMTGLNFRKGDFGDVDLHQSVVHKLGRSASYDQQVWKRSKYVDFQGNRVRVPGQTDQLLIAIQHGSVEGHAHSDWLLDCVAIIKTGEVDWTLFLNYCQSLDLNVNALITLSYLSSALNINVPKDIFKKLVRSSRSTPIEYFSALFQARPKEDHGIASDLLRSFFKQRRLRARRRASRAQMADVLLSISLTAIPYKTDGLQPEYTLKATHTVSSKSTDLTIELLVPVIDKTRRYEFELNTDDQHLARLTYKHRHKSCMLCLTAKIKTAHFPNWPTDAASQDVQLTLEARPRRVMSRDANNEVRELNDATPFALLKFKSTENG